MKRVLSESMALYEIARRLGTPDEVRACKLAHRRRVVQSKARKERRGNISGHLRKTAGRT